MDAEGVRAERAPIRALLVVALLAGLWAMHGLTAGHAPALPWSPTAVTLPAQHTSHSHEASPAGTAGLLVAPGGPASSPPVVLASVPDPGTSHGGHLGTDGACVATLAASLTLLLLRLRAHLRRRGSRLLFQRRWVETRGTRSRAGPQGLLRPSLTRLCVLRT